MNTANMIRLTVDLPEAQAADLALWLKRLHFNDWLSHTDSGQSKDERIEQAYRFRDATVLVEDALAIARGRRPR
ncbi:MAG: hypothetical protein ACJ8R9_31190 [Steroidobacteraceae bacterium]